MEMQGVIHGLGESTYHAHPALSSTGARRLLESPAKFQYWASHQQEPKAAFDLGHAVHERVLGVGSGIEVLDFDSYRTKAAQDARDAAREAGLVPMLARDMEPVNAMTEAVLAHPVARALLEQDGNAEASVFPTDPDTGVELRARFDFLPNPAKRQTVAVDLKTTSKSAAKAGFARTAADFGYDVQQGHYLHTYALESDDDPAMVFVVVEAEPPHLVAVHQLDRDFAEMGAVKAAHARHLFAECTRTGVWPGLPTGIQLIQAPFWAVAEYQESLNV